MIQTGLLEMKGFHRVELLWRKDTAWNKSVSQTTKISISLSPHAAALQYKETVAVVSQTWSREQRLAQVHSLL